MFRTHFEERREGEGEREKREEKERLILSYTIIFNSCAHIKGSNGGVKVLHISKLNCCSNNKKGGMLYRVSQVFEVHYRKPNQ